MALPIAYWLRYAAGRWQIPVLFLDHRDALRQLPRPHLRLAVDPRRKGLLNSGLSSSASSTSRSGSSLQPLRGHGGARPHLPALRRARPLRGLRADPPGAARGRAGSRRQRVHTLEAGDPPAGRGTRGPAFVLVFVLSAADYVTPQFLGGTDGAMLGVRIQAALHRRATGRSEPRCRSSCWRPSSSATCSTVVALRLLRLDRIRFVS